MVKVRLSQQRNEAYPSNSKDHDPVPEMLGRVCSLCVIVWNE